MYSKMTVKALKELCKERGIKGYSGKNKSQIINLLKKGKKIPKPKFKKESYVPDFPYHEFPSIPKGGKKKGGLSKVAPKMGKGYLSDIYKAVNANPLGRQVIQNVKQKYGLGKYKPKAGPQITEAEKDMLEDMKNKLQFMDLSSFRNPQRRKF